MILMTDGQGNRDPGALINKVDDTTTYHIEFEWVIRKLLLGDIEDEIDFVQWEFCCNFCQVQAKNCELLRIIKRRKCWSYTERVKWKMLTQIIPKKITP